jgi:hypothetical protein
MDTHSDNNGGVCRDLGWDRDEHLDVGRVAAKAGHLLESSKGRAGRSQYGKRSGECLHTDAVESLIRFGEFVRGGGGIMLKRALERLLYLATLVPEPNVETTESGSRRPNQTHLIVCQLSTYRVHSRSTFCERGRWAQCG